MRRERGSSVYVGAGGGGIKALYCEVVGANVPNAVGDGVGEARLDAGVFEVAAEVGCAEA